MKRTGALKESARIPSQERYGMNPGRSGSGREQLQDAIGLPSCSVSQPRAMR